MAYTTINKPSDYFNTVLYDGNATARNITTGFRPDWVWLKSRSNADHHQLFDVVRGAEERLYTSLNYAESNNIQALTSFNSDSFSLGTDQYINGSGKTYASWNWKANGTGSANTDGSINSTVSVNTTAGFSIVSYTGNGTAGATIGHGLGNVPKMIIIKQYSSNGGTENWGVYHNSIGNGKYLVLNLNQAEAISTGYWNNTTPTSSVFTLGNNDVVNNNTVSYIAYCFAEKTGFSKFGSYVGNGSTNGTFIYTGFKPSLILMKSTSHAVNWKIHDNKRDAINDGISASINANSNDAEDDNSAYAIDFLSNGFKQRNSNSNMNNPDYSYIYMAFAEAPLVGTNGVTAKAR